MISLSLSHLMDSYFFRSLLESCLDGDPPSHPGFHNLFRLVNKTHIQQELGCAAYG